MKRNLPGILYIPSIDKLWPTVTETVKATLISLLNELLPTEAVFIIATSDSPHSELDEEVGRGYFRL